MQDIAKPNYLETIVDPSFGTIIRRISNAGPGGVIKPMYSTIQAWNADETRMILYDQTNGVHQLLNGITYEFIRNLDDVRPGDLEQLFWDFNDPDILYYLDAATNEFVKYLVSTGNKEVLVNLKEISNCTGSISMGNDVQMMSWDSDVIGFRCDNSETFSYRISTQELVSFNIDDINYTAAMPAPSGNLFYHNVSSYDTSGNFKARLNKSKIEHSCLGRMVDGTDAGFSVTFDAGPNGGCLGNIVAFNLNTGDCLPVISEDLGYDYPKTGTHISAVAHKNPGWIAASMIGFEGDGQSLLDQELVVARVEPGNVNVYRIGHHRADEDEFDYWGEPHAVISPTGTRVLFGSDWSGSEDGISVESYVVELPSFN
ncbi:hypothetical protein PXC01_11555 [Maribacter sp. M208]|uniref:hypothetical protein n=1 Tax=Maribacter huludaoensis TaxID=3030010 RepID=UPI0023EDD189|nr:hypothetical protein [Maribacter huludaoensis]MDF4222226.1 hypothetical protein [Maribacter huludaoensis]